MNKPKNSTGTNATNIIEVLVMVFDEQSNPLKGANVKAINGGPNDTKTNTDDNGHTTVHVDGLGTLYISLAGYISKKINVNSRSQLMVRMLVDTPDNQLRQEVIEKYETISELVTGNSPDNDTVNQKCRIPLPPLDAKIAQRIGNTNN